MDDKQKFKMTVRLTNGLTEIRLNGQTLSVRQAVRDTDRADKEEIQNESATLDKQTQTYSQTEKKCDKLTFRRMNKQQREITTDK